MATHPPSCQCCAAEPPRFPPDIHNRPGLSAIDWRPGTYASFRSAMLESIAFGPPNPVDPDDTRWPGETRSALSAFTAREPDDRGILLLSGFAAMADVLGFHSERIANELFVATARERDSLLRMSRLLGWQAAPGSAAAVSLAFTLDSGAALKLRRGLKVMSVPGQDETAQVYETIGDIDADASLNSLPLYGQPTSIAPFPPGRTRIGIRLRPQDLKTGDTLLLTNGTALEAHRVAAIEAAPEGEHLLLVSAPAVSGTPSALRLLRELRLFGHDMAASWSYYDTNPALYPAQRWKTVAAGDPSYPVARGAGLSRYSLDRKLDDLKAGALLLADLGPGAAPRFVLATVVDVEAGEDVLGPVSGSVSKVGLRPATLSNGAPVAQPGWGLPAIADVRRTRLFEVDRTAIVARTETYPATLAGGTAWARIDDLPHPDLLAKGRAIIISGGAAPHLATITEAVALPAAPGGSAHMRIGFEPPLPAAVAQPRLNGNVAPASHGETGQPEPLGHGDGSRAFQQFRLQKKPVTRLVDATTPVPRAELEVRVNGEMWREAPSLFGKGGTDRIYTLATDDDGSTRLSFGDGVTGARLPSGALNIVATYRTGLGAAGRVRAGQLTTLLARPPGLREVRNPLPSDGGVEPESAASIRASAPASVRSFGRAVALSDFEDVARETGLVVRARADWAWVEWQQAIHLSVAGPEGAPLSSPSLATLHASLGRVRDPNHPLFLSNFWRVPLEITARILFDQALLPEAVEANARAAFAALVDFEHWPLGHAIHLSQLSAALQSAPGVVAVDVDRFRIRGSGMWSPVQRQRRGATAAGAQPHVRLFGARATAPAGQLDPVSAANLAANPDSPLLAAELPALLGPADLQLVMVTAL